MNISDLLLIFIEGCLFALFTALAFRLYRDKRLAEGDKAQAIFRFASLFMAEKAVLAIYLFASTLYLIAGPAQEAWVSRMFDPGFHKLMVLLGSPLLCMITYYLVRAKKARIGAGLCFQGPIVLALILFVLTGWHWTIKGMTLTLLTYICINNVYIIVQLHRYKVWLCQIYSNTSHRGVTWAFGFLVFMMLQGVLWYVLCIFLDQTWTHIVYYVQVIASDLVYVYMLEMQDYDVEEVASTEVAETAENPLEEQEIENAFDAAMKELDVEIPRYCKEERHFTDPDLTVFDLTQAVNSNRTYVAKWFNLRGMNFNSYINNLRLEYAEQLLRTTRETPSDICDLAGFSTMHTFARVFKTKYGCTPAQYKAALSQDSEDNK